MGRHHPPRCRRLCRRFQLQQLYDKLADDVGAWPEKLEELPTWIHQALQDRPPALNLHAGPGPGTSGAQHEPHITAYYTTARGRQVPIRLPPVGGATPAADGARAASVAELLYELYQKAAEDCKQCQAREAARARQESERQELMQRLAAAHGLQASAAVGKAKGKPSSPADKMAQALGAIHASGAAPSAGAPAAAAADGHHTEVAGAAPEEAEPDYSDLLTVRVAAGKRRHRAF